MCIVSMIRYDTYRRYIDPIHDTYRRDRNNLKHNIQTHVCIKYVPWIEVISLDATLATGHFRNSPWHLGHWDNLLTILLVQTIWRYNVETMTHIDRYTVTLTLGLWQQRTSLGLLPKVITVTMIRVNVYIHIITLPKFTLEEDPLKTVQSNRRGAQQTPQSVTHWLCQRRVRWPQHFNCHASFPASFATELHEEAYWKHLPALLFIFTAPFRFFEVISQLSPDLVIAHMRKSILERR